MEIIRNKRLRKSTPPVPSFVSLDLHPSSSSSSLATTSVLPVLKPGDVSDPVLRRKLRNRESAERSRQKVNHLVDSLTAELCASYAKEQELTRALNARQSANSNQATKAFHDQKVLSLPVQPNPFQAEDYFDMSDEHSLSDITSSSSMCSGSSSPAVDYVDFTGISNIDWNIQDNSLQEWLLLNSL